MKRLALFLAAIPCSVMAADLETLVTLKNNQFSPAEVHVPAGKKVKLIVRNQDASAEEFESFELNREKVIPGNASGFVYIGPLAPGRYPFFGDFHQQTARGTVIAE